MPANLRYLLDIRKDNGLVTQDGIFFFEVKTVDIYVSYIISIIFVPLIKIYINGFIRKNRKKTKSSRPIL